jgi:hypothetical protein
MHRPMHKTGWKKRTARNASDERVRETSDNVSKFCPKSLSNSVRESPQSLIEYKPVNGFEPLTY